MVSPAHLVIPRRPDGGHRDDLWAWARHWWDVNLGWPVREGHHAEGRFNRSAAINAGVAQLDADWTEFVIVDSDVVVRDPRQVIRAVEVARRHQRVTYCHDQWCGLTRGGTRTIMSAELGPSHSWGRYVQTRNWFPFSQCVVVPRSVWEIVGGMDERFKGWGWEDIALDRSARTLAGGTERVHGELFHLWHPRSEEKEHGHPDYEANKALGSRYKRYAGDSEAIIEILGEPGGPLGEAAIPKVCITSSETLRPRSS